MVQQLLDEKEEVVKKVMESFVDFSSSYSSSSSGVDDSVREETHVLAVDDSLVDRKVIEKLLKISSCKVTAVDSGKRALELLGLEEEEKMKRSVEGLKIDLIITDYCMPGMTGYELLKKIKESSTFRETPVVIMSSENVVTRIHRCLEEGAEDFIVKPVKLSDVKRLMGYIMMGMQREQQDVVVNVGSKTTTPPKSVVTLNKDNSNINHNKRKQPDEPAATADISTSPDLSSSSPSSSSETSSFMSLSPPESITSSPPQSPSPDQPSSPSLLLPEQSVIDSSPPTEVMQESDDAADQLVLVTPTISAETTASTAL